MAADEGSDKVLMDQKLNKPLIDAWLVFTPSSADGVKDL